MEEKIEMTLLRRLYVGKNRGADQAKKELDKHAIEYVILESNDEKSEPVLVTQEGYFEGLKEISQYSKYWASMSKYGTNSKNSIYVF